MGRTAGATARLRRPGITQRFARDRTTRAIRRGRRWSPPANVEDDAVPTAW